MSVAQPGNTLRDVGGRMPLADEVYRTLRKMILQGPIESGVKVVESQLANLLGVSRTPVREAVKRMEYELRGPVGDPSRLQHECRASASSATPARIP